MNENTSVSSTALESDAGSWQRSLAQAIRDPNELIRLLDLPDSLREPARRAAEQFGLVVPRSYLARIERACPHDPLLLQILPTASEAHGAERFTDDPLAESECRVAPGLLKKYAGRALLVTTGTCAINCRYCFRRNYPYGLEPSGLDEWEPAMRALERDESIHEVLLSGGDPLVLSNARLESLCERLASIEHLARIRIHTRLPIVLPDRVDEELIGMLKSSRLTAIIVVHANHPNEIAFDCADSLKALVDSGLTVLNQSVLLRGVNDSADVLAQLSERLVNLGVIPYYLHQLDRVTGAAHFEVPVEQGRLLIEELRHRLPGYAVPQYVQERPGELHKTPLL